MANTVFEDGQPKDNATVIEIDESTMNVAASASTSGGGSYSLGGFVVPLDGESALPSIISTGFTVSEPSDGGNLDLSSSTLSATSCTLIPRGSVNEAGGNLYRWEPMLFKMVGVSGETTQFNLDLADHHGYLANADAAQTQLKPVWSTSYPGATWNEFDNYDRATNGEIEFSNNDPWSSSTIYVAIKEKEAVSEYYSDILTRIVGSSYVSPTASGGVDGEAYKIGEIPSYSTTSRLNRVIPAQALYGLKIEESSRNPDKIVIITSGVHPYENQNKWVWRGFVDFITSEDSKAQTYRDHFITLAYPHLNPDGEVAGLWRGPAADPTIDLNRNWGVGATYPTITAHESAFSTDLGDVTGTFAALLDCHQSINFGDEANTDDGFVFIDDTTPANNWVTALQAYEPDMNARISDSSSSDHVRAYGQNDLGAVFAATPERVIYNTSVAEEEACGANYARALADRAVAGDY